MMRIRQIVSLAAALVAGMSLLHADAAGLPHGEAPGAHECQQAGGWRWGRGETQPQRALQARNALTSSGVSVASVRAWRYGETDGCGAFHESAIDFDIALQSWSLPAFGRSATARTMHDTIKAVLGPDVTVGAIAVQTLDGAIAIGPQTFAQISETNTAKISTALVNEAAPASSALHTRRVLAISLNPLLSTGETLIENRGWLTPTLLSQETSAFFEQASRGRMRFTIAATIVYTGGWPAKESGYRFTEKDYFDALAGLPVAHATEMADYNALIAQFDICGKANRGEIDEVWIYNGPYFGFWESTLVGPNAFFYNSNPVPNAHGCQRLVPIMGPSPERAVDSAVHNFGHRMESTMRWVYGGWLLNQLTSNWDRYALVAIQAPNFGYSGCGNTHFPPNALSDYDYDRVSPSVSGNCDEFAAFPELANPPNLTSGVTCAVYGCQELLYHAYWFGRLPAATGCGLDRVANDWWAYFAEPALALVPATACTAPTATSTATTIPIAPPAATLSSTPTPALPATQTETPAPTSTPELTPIAEPWLTVSPTAETVTATVTVTGSPQIAPPARVFVPLVVLGQ